MEHQGSKATVNEHYYYIIKYVYVAAVGQICETENTKFKISNKIDVHNNFIFTD